MAWWSRFFRGTGGGYEAGTRESEARVYQAGRNSYPIDEDRHIGEARPRIVLEGRYQDRNNGLLYGVANRIADYSVPTALPRFATASKEWNDAARLFFKRWARKDRCDIRRLRSFDDLVWLAVRQSYIDGDGGFVLLEDGRVQMVEGELIATPDPAPQGKVICNGVELDRYGAPVAFWIAPRNEAGFPSPDKARRVLAGDFVFFRQFTRCDSVRGVPPISSITSDLIDQKELHQSYLAKTKHDTKDGTLVTTADGYMPNIPHPVSGEGNDKPPPPRPASMEDRHLRMYFLRNGEDVRQIPPSTPSANIVDYEKNLVRFMASALGIPAEFWTLDLTNMSWSTANATVKMAGDQFRRVHEWAEEQVIRPLIDWRIAKAIERGELPPAPTVKVGAFEVSQAFEYRLAVPEYLWADEDSHLKAVKTKFQLGLDGMTAVADEYGKTVGEMLDEREELWTEIYARCKRLEERTGKPISPLQFINAETSGIQTVVAESPKDRAEAEEKAGEGAKK